MKCINKLTDEDFGLDIVPFDNPRHRYGARGIVFNKDNKIAVLNKTLKNEYKLVGGGIEEDEDPTKAFKREVLEETGCIVEIIGKLGITEEYKSQTNFKQISNVFVGKVMQDTKQLSVTQKEKDEGARLLWETPQRALELITDCFGKLVKSDYESVYATKFVVLRDRKILEYYINNSKQ